MQHECKITVLETKVFPELQEKYLADPKSGACPCFKSGSVPSVMKDWALKHIDKCEVIGPKRFRDEIQRTVMGAYKKYWK